MPELPEVEVIRLGLLPHLQGQQITGIYCGEKRLRLAMPCALLEQWLRNALIKDLKRRGKYLLIETDNKATLIIHLGMSGRLGLFPIHSARHRHDHFGLVLHNTLELRFNDTRRFGSIQIVTPDNYPNLPPLAGLGPEPFSTEFSTGYLLSKAAGRKQPIKNLLMDSRIVAGIGNIYASEILFASRISPITPVTTLSPTQWQTVIAKTRLILKQAIACGGTTIADYVNSSGQPGYFQNELRVYGRKNLPCARCATPILKTVMAGRATYHCPCCQP